MINTSNHPLTVVKNGVEYRLDSLAYNISTKKGIAGGMAGLRGASAIVPGRSGSLWMPGRKRNDGSSILSMWAQDKDENGNGSSDPYLQWRTNQDFLMWLFDTSNGQIELRDYLTSIGAPGSSLAGKPYRRAMVEVPTAIDPEVLGRVFGEFKVECIINEVYWEDPTLETFASPIGASAVGTHTMNEFDGMTAPIEDAIITVSGFADAPVVSDPITGHSISLESSVPAGSQWVVDCRNFTSKIGTTSVTSSTVARGRFAPRYFGISAEAGAPRIQFAATATDASTQITVQARRKFH